MYICLSNPCIDSLQNKLTKLTMLTKFTKLVSMTETTHRRRIVRITIFLNILFTCGHVRKVS